jgi:CRP-like cAMP-binding protein
VAGKLEEVTMAAEIPANEFTEIDLFQGLSVDEIAEVVASGERVEIKTGDWICSEGDPADYFYILEIGAVTVHKSVSDRKVEVGRLTAKAGFGEMGIVTNQPRSASILAIEDGVVWRVAREHFQALWNAGGPAITKLTLNLARTVALRLGRLNQAFAELVYEQRKTSKETSAELASFRDKLYSEWSF